MAVLILYLPVALISVEIKLVKTAKNFGCGHPAVLSNTDIRYYYNQPEHNK